MGLGTTKNTRIQVERNAKSIQAIDDRDNPVFRRISSNPIRSVSSLTPGIVSRAVCSADAGLGSTISATRYSSDGTTGDAITVYCSIANGTDLNEATPRLEIGLDIHVTISVFDIAGEPESRWTYVGPLQASEDCTCEQPDAVFNSVTIASDENITFDGVGGNSYLTYNSSAGEMELWTDGVKITSWKA